MMQEDDTPSHTHTNSLPDCNCKHEQGSCCDLGESLADDLLGNIPQQPGQSNLSIETVVEPDSVTRVLEQVAP